MKSSFSFHTYLLGLLTLGTLSLHAQTGDLRQRISTILQSKDAKVGVSIRGPLASDTLTVNGAGHYPMQSVYKFHLALAVLHRVDKGELSLDQGVSIRPEDVQKKMYSPLREAYPQGNVTLPLRDLLHYVVSQSDNVACDILFRLMGGTEPVNRYIHSLGIRDVQIVATEAEMHASWPVQYGNWSTPAAATELLEKYYAANILSVSSRDSLWQWLTHSRLSDRIGGLLPAGTVAGHKSGTSDTNAEHLTAAINDIGVVLLPDGRRFSIAVFVSDSHESDSTNTAIIAQISRAVWDHYTRRP